MAAFVYCRNEYSTAEEVESAVTAMKSRLDNNPTDWVSVQEVTAVGDNLYQLPSEYLTDAEINALTTESEGLYSLCAVMTGDSLLGISASDVIGKVAEFRTAYATAGKVNTIFTDVTEQGFGGSYTPTNEDMSGYVE